jgi:hypothetical protein
VSELRILVAERQRGKTTALLNWVSAGHRVPHYPGWSRVLVVHTLQAATSLKGQGWWEKLEDFDHRVYSLEEWRNARHVDPFTEVVYDEGLFFLPDLPGRLVGVSFTGELW